MPTELYPAEDLYPSDSLYPGEGPEEGEESGGELFSRIAVTREFPPDRLAWRIAAPRTGQTIARWAEDEHKTENVISGITKSGEMPGGHKEAGGTLPRDPRIDWPDTAPFFDVFLEQPGGEIVWEGRIDQVPESDGDRMVLEPKAVGHQKALEDRRGLQLGFISSDLSKWGEPSTQRKINLTSFYSTRSATIDSGWQDAGETEPAILIQIIFSEGHPLGEVWLNGGGVPIGQVRYDFTNVSGVLEGTHDIVRLSGDDLAVTTVVSETDHGTTSATNQSVSATSAAFRYALIQTFYEGAYTGEGTDKKAWKNLRVLSWLATQNLALQGTWPDVGYTAKQMLACSIPLFTYLTVNEEEMEDLGYVIQQAWFSEPGGMDSVVKELTKYELLDWFVMRGKQFELRVPGSYGRFWQAYAGPSELKETGEDGSRLWDRIIGRYTDVDGSMRTVGWPGSGANTESETLIITDPDHPAVRAGITREDVLDLKGISTPQRAIEACERWLVDANELSHAGEATLRGYIQDDCRVFRPVSQVQPGDWIRFPDAGSNGTGYRKIVAVSYDHDTRTASVTLDAPPNAIEALLERYQAALEGLAL